MSILKWFRKQYLMGRLEAWERREHIICYVEGGYWGRNEGPDSLYVRRLEERHRLSRELERLELGYEPRHNPSCQCVECMAQVREARGA